MEEINGTSTASGKISLETIIRRTLSSIIFLILLFSPISLIEVMLYSIRWIITKEPIPDWPYSFQFIKRMW